MQANKINYFIQLIIAICSFAASAHSQSFYNNWQEQTHFIPDSGQIGLGVQNFAFFKDNEYFNPIWPGYTLLGNSFSAEAQYFFYPKLKLKLGYEDIRFWGQKNPYISQLYITVSYIFNSKWTLNMGKLDGNISHQYIEPMLNPENRFLHPLEQGLQFVYKGKHLQSDIYIDWEKFLLWGQPFQEHLTQGTVNKFSFQWQKTSLNLHFQSIITHHGGQIDQSPLSVETLINTASGIELKRQSGKIQLSTNHYLLTFNDNSPTKKYPFTAGRAYWGVADIILKHHQLELGYWYGDFFITTKGNPLFRNVPTTNLDWQNIQPQRSLVMFKYRYTESRIKKLNFDVQAEVYYDIFHQITDYAFGLYIRFSHTKTIHLK